MPCMKKEITTQDFDTRYLEHTIYSTATKKFVSVSHLSNQNCDCEPPF